MKSLCLCFSYSLPSSGFKISLLRAYFSQYVWFRSSENPSRRHYQSRYSRYARLWPFFPRIEFERRRITEVEIWTHTRLSFDVMHMGIANSSERNRWDALLVYKSVLERIEVTNWNACCVSSRSLRRFSRATSKDVVVGASIKYATIYAARWVRIYALISRRCYRSSRTIASGSTTAKMLARIHR